MKQKVGARDSEAGERIRDIGHRTTKATNRE